MDSINYSEEIDLQKYWLVLKRRWLPSIGAFGTVLMLTCLYVLTREPSYEATGSLMFRTNRAAALTGVGGEIGRLEALGYQNNPLDTQAEVVQSVPVLEKTIELLNLRDDEGQLLSVRDFMEQLQVKGLPGTDVLQITYSSDDPEQAAAVVNKIMEIYLEENVQSNRAEAASAREFITSQLPQTEAAVRQADLALRQFKEENNVIALPEEATSAVENIATLEDQIAQARAQWVNATARANELQKLIGVNPQQAAALSSLNQAPGVQSVLTQYQEAQSQLAIQQMRYRTGHPAIANLQRQVNALESLLQQRVAQMIGPGQSIAIGDLQLGEQRQELIGELVQAEANRIGLAGQLSALTEARSIYRARASTLPRLEQTQRELERKLQAAQTTYETLLTRLQEIQVAENQNVGNARIVSPALVPVDPSDPSAKLVVVAGGLMGILLGIATAFGIDVFDRSVKTVKQAKELMGFTVLGIIPNLSKTGKNKLRLDLLDQSIPTIITQDVPHLPNVPLVITRDLPRSPISEAYRMLQANLRFLSSDKQPKTIVITSSVAQEGKSEVSANLATAIAQLGRRVLLVDADMRCPMQHHTWNLTNAVGLSNVIVEQVSFADAVLEVMPNLHVLSAGVVPPNPVALLDSKRMVALVEAFAQEYDFVIFDTPPILGTADATVLGKMVDGILLVVRPGAVDSTNAVATKEFLAQSGQRVLGMVLNGIDIRNEPDSYFYYAGSKIPEQAESAAIAGSVGSR
jgi:capsular exopolysaccharide synthesis family protein